MRRYKIFLINLVCLVFLLISVNFVSAMNPDVGITMDQLMETNEFAITSAETGGFDLAFGLPDLMGKIISTFFGLLATIFIILIIYSGITWMTAGGDEQKVTKAKKTIQRAVIGLIIVVMSYSITYIVFSYMPWGSGPGVVN